MDGNILQSLTGTAPVASESGAKRTDKPNGDAFSACLDDAGRTKGDAGKANVQMIDDNKKKDSKKETQKQDGAAEAQTNATKNAVAKMSPAMQKLMHKNLDTLSISDKQALRVGEFSREGEIKQAAVPKGAAAVPVTGQLASSALAQAGRNGGRAEDRVVGNMDRAQRLGLPVDDRAVKEGRSKHVRDEHQSPHQPNLDNLLAQEIHAGEQVNKADQVKAYEQRQNVLDQIIKHVEVRNFQNQTELNLRLNPEYLGEMNINLVHTKDGGVTTHIKTSSRVTRQLLQDCKDELSAQAESKGIRLGKINISLVDQVS
jgi:flagellar hook-length control protein FliK